MIRRRLSTLGTRAAWGVALVALAFSVWWGRRLQTERPHIFLGAAPLVGRDPLDGWDWRFGWGLVVAAACGAVMALATARDAVGRLGRVTLPLVAGLAAAVFSVMLAAVDGADGLRRGAEHRTEYLWNLDLAPPPLEFLRSFLDRIDGYSVHVRGHPPGFVLLLQVLDAVGLAGVWPVVGLSVVGTAATAALVTVAVRAVAGSTLAVSVVPLLVVSPYTLWMMTSADAVYSAIGAASVAAGALAVRRRGATAAAWGAISGVAAGVLASMTYAAATFGLGLAVFAAASVRDVGRRAVPAVVAAVLSFAAVLGALAIGGFWWVDGARETQRQYWLGTAQFRPGWYFAVANLAAALVAIGPVGYGGLVGAWRRRRLLVGSWRLVAVGAVGLLASHSSQYTRAEVERIWLLFYPWLLLPAGALLASLTGRTAGALVAAQATAAILLQAVLVSKW